MSQINYVQMPQNDVAQIEQIAREYEAEPAKGIAHGVQKDAIQNAFGARLIARESKAFDAWRFSLELIQINDQLALTFWDEGTTGLTGDIISAGEITHRISNNTLGPNQRLGRFLARLVSGQNVGPGIFGRGKLVFQAASETRSILIDSLRSNDGQYIALDRRLKESLLMQPEMPLVGKTAKDFVFEMSNGKLKPLSVPGTRITIYNVLPNIAEDFNRSFQKAPYEYRESLAHMIEETWWEILSFGAKIFLKNNNHLLSVELHDPLKSITSSKDGVEGVRVYEKNHVAVTVESQRHYLKQLRLVVMPSPLDDEYQQIWLQRKRMKVGGISTYLYSDVHPKIRKRLTGYVVLEPSLEDIIEKAEGTTHYSFNISKPGIKQIRQELRNSIHSFEQELGLNEANQDTNSQRRLMNSMKELSELATELGLVTAESFGQKRSSVDIIVASMKLPNEGSLRVELGDRIGPVSYCIRNMIPRCLIGTFNVEASQGRTIKQAIYQINLTLKENETESITLPAFPLDKDIFVRGKSLELKASFIDSASNKEYGSATRILYVGMEPLVTPTNPVHLQVTCLFPRKGARRIEVMEVIRNIQIKATNQTPFDMKVRLTSSVRHCENQQAGRPTTPLFTVLDEADFLLHGQSDHVVFPDNIEVTQNKFQSVLDTLPSPLERKCDLCTSIRLVNDCDTLNLPRQYVLSKTSIPFYIGVDPPGVNIFRNCEEKPNAKDGRLSWYEGDNEQGYVFYLNPEHPTYRLMSEGSDDLRSWCEKEQMLRQAYQITFDNDVFKGPATDYKEELSNPDTPHRTYTEIFDRVVGLALFRMIGGK